MHSKWIYQMQMQILIKTNSLILSNFTQLFLSNVNALQNVSSKCIIVLSFLSYKFLFDIYSITNSLAWIKFILVFFVFNLKKSENFSFVVLFDLGFIGSLDGFIVTNLYLSTSIWLDLSWLFSSWSSIICIVLSFMILFNFFTGLLTGLLTGLPADLLVGLTSGFISGLISGFISGLIFDLAGDLIVDLADGLMSCLTSGFISGLIFTDSIVGLSVGDSSEFDEISSDSDFDEPNIINFKSELNELQNFENMFKVIDYEYAGYTYRCFDIGNFINELYTDNLFCIFHLFRK